MLADPSRSQQEALGLLLMRRSRRIWWWRSRRLRPALVLLHLAA